MSTGLFIKVNCRYKWYLVENTNEKNRLWSKGDNSIRASIIFLFVLTCNQIIITLTHNIEYIYEHTKQITCLVCGLFFQQYFEILRHDLEIFFGQHKQNSEPFLTSFPFYFQSHILVFQIVTSSIIICYILHLNMN